MNINTEKAKIQIKLLKILSNKPSVDAKRSKSMKKSFNQKNNLA